MSRRVCLQLSGCPGEGGSCSQWQDLQGFGKPAKRGWTFGAGGGARAEVEAGRWEGALAWEGQGRLVCPRGENWLREHACARPWRGMGGGGRQGAGPRSWQNCGPSTHKPHTHPEEGAALRALEGPVKGSVGF